VKVFITGISGYVARVTLPCLLEDPGVESVTGIDLRPPGVVHEKLEFVEGDIRSHPLADLVAGADTVVHMAFIVTEIRDKKKIYDINVNGTRRVLEAVGGSGARKLVVASSICAYGSHPDHPEVITEGTPLRGNRESYYSHTKLEMERMLDDFEKGNPDIIVTRLRPSILCGAGTDNFFLSVLRQRVIFFPSENPEGLPVVHEDDVGRAFCLAIKKDAPGAFNICGGNLAVKEMCRVLDRPSMGLPYFILKPITDLGFATGLYPMSSHWTVLGRHPFRASCEKAERELGWKARKTPVEAFEEMVEAWRNN